MKVMYHDNHLLTVAGGKIQIERTNVLPDEGDMLDLSNEAAVLLKLFLEHTHVQPSLRQLLKMKLRQFILRVL